MVSGHRKTDATITIRQDNDRQAIEVVELNHSAQELLGFDKHAVHGQPLAQLLPERIQTLLTEYVEFDIDGNDVGTVLSKVQRFCVLDSKKRELPLSLKVLRIESLDKHQYFRLILQNQQMPKANEAFRGVLRENFKGHEVLDSATGLANRASLSKDLELVIFYANKGEMSACFAVLELDSAQDYLSQYGAETVAEIMRHIAQAARGNLRGDDTIGSLSESRLGLIMLDTPAESARMVLNRLRWLVAATPFEGDNVSIPLTVSIAFSKIGGRIYDKALIADLEYYLDHQRAAASNHLQEVGEVEKREGEDRRRFSMPMPFDRRGGDRRER